MTLIRKLKDFSSPANLGSIDFAPPVLNGLTGCFLPRRDATRSVVNLAPGGNKAVMVGAPTYNRYGAVLGPGGYLQTDIKESASFTLISVARKSTQVLALISSQYGSSSLPFASMHFRSGSERRLSVRTRVTNDAPETSLGYNVEAGGNDFEFFTGICNTALSNHTVYMPRLGGDVVGGNPRSVAFSGAREVSNDNWRIGWANENYPGSTEHMLDMVFNRALSEAEVRAIYAYAQTWFAARGMAI